MKDKYLSEDYTEEELESSGKYSFLSSQSNDLFDEASYIPMKLISVKKVKLPKNGQDWRILEDGKMVLEIKGTRLSKKEKEYLNTTEGFLFLIKAYKEGNTTLNKIKNLLKNL